MGVAVLHAGGDQAPAQGGEVLLLALGWALLRLRLRRLGIKELGAGRELHGVELGGNAWLLGGATQNHRLMLFYFCWVGIVVIIKYNEVVVLGYIVS